MQRSERKRAQVSLEIATALICIFILLLASVKLCAWLVGRMVVRQEDFESTRVNAGIENIEVPVNETNTARYQNLDFFR